MRSNPVGYCTVVPLLHNQWLVHNKCVYQYHYLTHSFIRSLKGLQIIERLSMDMLLKGILWTCCGKQLGINMLPSLISWQVGNHIHVDPNSVKEIQGQDSAWLKKMSLIIKCCLSSRDLLTEFRIILCLNSWEQMLKLIYICQLRSLSNTVEYVLFAKNVFGI